MPLRLALTAALLVALIGCGGDAPDSSTSASADSSAIGSIERLDPALDTLIPSEASVEVLAKGFEWSEGPVWVPDGDYLLLSDIPRNAIFRWAPGDSTRLWLQPSGYTGTTPRGGEPGSNALLLDAEGRLVLCQHGDRRIARMDAPLSDPQPQFTTLADTYDSQRFNSPNDAVFHSSGALYFTDPPYGLAEGPDDPARELDFSGVYRLDPDGTVTLLTDSLSRPNGIGLSPDEQTLYVANSDPDRALWMAYDVQLDGSITNGRVFFDATEWTGDRPGLPDGLALDRDGHLFATGPGGVLIFDPDGAHLGTIRVREHASNVAFGGADGSTLFITADMYLLRVPLTTTGLAFADRP